MNDPVAWFWLLLTLLLYGLARALFRRFPTPLLSPLIVTSGLLVVILLTGGVPYARYNALSQWLSAMLGPATIAFALPVFEYRQVIRRHWLSLSTGVVVGMAVAFLSTLGLSRLFGLPELIERSLVLRSISTPFAIAATPRLGGQADLAAVFVVLTGLLGMVLGDLLLRHVRVTSVVARGALFGAAAHAVGTSAAYRRDPEEGVISSLTMIIAGILMVLLAPWIGRFY